MPFNPGIHHRRSIRLKGYDYSQAGAYFVTACARGRKCLFGEVVDGQMHLSVFGEMVARCWDDLPRHYPTVELDAFVVMPNHVHGIVVLTDGVGAGLRPAPTSNENTISPQENGETVTGPRPLSEIVRAFKSFSSRRINERLGTAGTPVWQRTYWDTVIRNEQALIGFRQYIENNPAQWDMDQLHPNNPSKW